MKCQFNPIPSKPFRSSICWKGNSFPHFCPKNHPPARRDRKYAEWKAPITSMKDVSREKVQIQMAFKKIITSSLVLRLKSLTNRFRESADSHSQFTYYTMLTYSIIFTSWFHNSNDNSVMWEMCRWCKMLQVKPRRRQDMDDMDDMDDGKSAQDRAGHHWPQKSSEQPWASDGTPAIWLHSSGNTSYFQAPCLNIILSLSKRPRFM